MALKDLPPEERIKRLKKLEKEKKKEIEEAKKLLKESEDELTERQKWADKVPIPEIAMDDSAGLSGAGKEVREQVRGVDQKVDEEDEEKPAKKVEQAPELNLEETVARQKLR